MATEIKLPVLGENVESATVVKLLVKAGDTIARDQPIMELETEKASVDLPAPAAGTAKTIQVKEGDTVKVGQILLTIEENGQPAATPPATAAKENPPEPKKVSPPPAAPSPAPPPAERPAEPPAEPLVERPAEPPPAPKVETTEPKPAAPVESPASVAAPAAPSLRRMARELGIDIHAVTGSGPEGRITEEDIRNYARSIILNATVTESGPATALPDFSRWGEIERKTMSGIRRKTAEHVHEAWSSIPHVTQFGSADVTDIEKMREPFTKKVEAAGGKLSITAVIVKVAALALKAFPHFNVSLDPHSGELVFKKFYNIGVAVDTEHGLLVPVIRDADKKNVQELSVELTQIAAKARSRKLAVEEMQGGTFTVTNLGGIGGSYFTPIVNSPEVAILGVSRAAYQPVFIDGAFQPRLMLPLSLSYDHRAIDGADGARFLRWIVEALEQPFKLIVEG
jgi:pyruvate dehydrogenase E2 component (dihydrolipoamide acetyltransferase)